MQRDLWSLYRGRRWAKQDVWVCSVGCPPMEFAVHQIPLALFPEFSRLQHGPWSVAANGRDLVPRNTSLNMHANVIYLEQVRS